MGNGHPTFNRGIRVSWVYKPYHWGPTLPRENNGSLNPSTFGFSQFHNQRTVDSCHSSPKDLMLFFSQRITKKICASEEILNFYGGSRHEVEKSRVRQVANPQK